jgi:hypothetical protein
VGDGKRKLCSIQAPSLEHSAQPGPPAACIW